MAPCSTLNWYAQCTSERIRNGKIRSLISVCIFLGCLSAIEYAPHLALDVGDISEAIMDGHRMWCQAKFFQCKRERLQCRHLRRCCPSNKCDRQPVRKSSIALYWRGSRLTLRGRFAPYCTSDRYIVELNEAPHHPQYQLERSIAGSIICHENDGD